MSNIGYIYSIYPINSIDENDIYYGSTNNINRRWSLHKHNYNTKKTYYTSFILFDKYGIDHCKFEIIEEIKYNNKLELLNKEKYYIDNNKCINKMSPIGRTNNPNTLQKYKDKKKEYYENNKEILLEKQKKYNETNRDIRILKQREYHENNKDKAKEYYEKNKDIISEKKKIIYEQNKEKYNEPIICEYCNCLTSLNNIKRHQKTKKCQKYQ